MLVRHGLKAGVLLAAVRLLVIVMGLARLSAVASGIPRTEKGDSLISTIDNEGNCRDTASALAACMWPELLNAHEATLMGHSVPATRCQDEANRVEALFRVLKAQLLDDPSEEALVRCLTKLQRLARVYSTVAEGDYVDELNLLEEEAGLDIGTLEGMLADLPDDLDDAALGNMQWADLVDDATLVAV